MVIKTHMRWITALSSFMLGGCNSTHQPQSIPEQGLTVSQIYHQSTKEVKPLPRLDKVKPVARPVLSKPKHEASSFKPLPNPSIDLYIFPHVTLIGDEQLIKPGYTTAFYLYKTNQYALASELY